VKIRAVFGMLPRNLGLLTDLYQFTMTAAYLNAAYIKEPSSIFSSDLCRLPILFDHRWGGAGVRLPTGASTFELGY
jgi:hypothetical protein